MTDERIPLDQAPYYQKGYLNGKRDAHDKKWCPCGGVILADTEDCQTPLCADCTDDILSDETKRTQGLIKAIEDEIARCGIWREGEKALKDYRGEK